MHGHRWAQKVQNTCDGDFIFICGFKNTVFDNGSVQSKINHRKNMLKTLELMFWSCQPCYLEIWVCWNILQSDFHLGDLHYCIIHLYMCNRKFIRRICIGYSQGKVSGIFSYLWGLVYMYIKVSSGQEHDQKTTFTRIILGYLRFFTSFHINSTFQGYYW